MAYPFDLPFGDWSIYDNAEQEPQSAQSFFNLPPPVPTSFYTEPVQATDAPTGVFRQGRGKLMGSGSPRDPYGTQQKIAKLEMEAMAERDAQAMMSDLFQTNPTTPDYLTKRTQTLARHPYALMNPAASQALKAFDYHYEQSMRDPDHAAIREAALAGVSPEELESVRLPNGRIDTFALSRITGERQRNLKPKHYEMSEDDRRFRDLGRQMKDSLQLGIAPERRKALQQEYLALQSKLYPELSGGDPQIPESAQQQQPIMDVGHSIQLGPGQKISRVK